MDAAKLVTAARRAVGTDAYVMYPNSRLSIPETVLWGFASACLLEFVKPFFDFKGLGEGARKSVEGLLEAWRAKADFQRFCEVEGVKADVMFAIAALPKPTVPEQSSAGVKHLTSALMEVGLNSEDASSLAAKIESAVHKGV